MNDMTRRAISRAAAALDAAEEIATVGHIAPDADALGSALGVARSALLAGKKAVTSFASVSRSWLTRPLLIPSFRAIQVLLAPIASQCKIFRSRAGSRSQSPSQSSRVMAR